MTLHFDSFEARDKLRENPSETRANLSPAFFWLSPYNSRSFFLN